MLWFPHVPLISTSAIPAQASIKGTAAAFLETLGDPNSGRGTQWNMVGRLYKLIRECEVRMIFVDEFQHTVDRKTQRVLYEVADFLKDLINQTCVPMVLIGRLGEAEAVMKVNPQLDRRVGTPIELQPFAWDREHADTILEFRQLMKAIDQALPFDPSGLSEEDMAYRISTGSLPIVLSHAIFTKWPARFLIFLDLFYLRTTHSPYQCFEDRIAQYRRLFAQTFGKPAYSWLFDAFEEHAQVFRTTDWYLQRQAK